MNDYLIYILIWAVMLIVLFVLFKSVSAKMKKTDDLRTKNSLFTLLMILSLPLILAAVLGPILLVAGDENMPPEYKYAYGVISLFVIGYLVYLQTVRRKKS